LAIAGQASFRFPDLEPDPHDLMPRGHDPGGKERGLRTPRLRGGVGLAASSQNREWPALPARRVATGGNLLRSCSIAIAP